MLSSPLCLVCHRASWLALALWFSSNMLEMIWGRSSHACTRMCTAPTYTESPAEKQHREKTHNQCTICGPLLLHSPWLDSFPFPNSHYSQTRLFASYNMGTNCNWVRMDWDTELALLCSSASTLQLWGYIQPNTISSQLLIKLSPAYMDSGSRFDTAEAVMVRSQSYETQILK